MLESALLILLGTCLPAAAFVLFSKYAPDRYVWARPPRAPIPTQSAPRGVESDPPPTACLS